jgi:hypothetical protein
MFNWTLATDLVHKVKCGINYQALLTRHTAPKLIISLDFMNKLLILAGRLSDIE